MQNKMYVSSNESFNKLFAEMKTELLKVDPVAFTETYLKLDGEPFKVSGAGWKYMADIYRYIALKAINPDGKPIVILKGRQVGATVMAGALDLYFTASGLFGGQDKQPITVLHCFPDLSRAKKFSQVKLDALINSATNDYVNQQKVGYNPRTKKISSDKPDNITLKQFKGGNNLWIESLGNNSDRIRGITCDVIFYDECFPFEQYIETIDGPVKIGILYKNFINGDIDQYVKTYNEINNIFEYKKILNAWHREQKELILLHFGARRIKCTDNHKFLTENGWKSVNEMSVGDLVITSPGAKNYIRSLNDDQLQVILGSFLGNGRVEKHGLNRYKLRITNNIQQEEYCKWKASIFSTNTEVILKNVDFNKQSISFCTNMFGSSNDIPQAKTYCPQWIIDKLDAKGIAVWFMDNNHMPDTDAVITLSTKLFDEDSQKRIVEKFKLFGIECNYVYYGVKNKGGHYVLHFNRDESVKLYDLIVPYIYNNHEYSNKYHAYSWNNKFNLYGFTVVDKIVKLDTIEDVYDIEVEDNHNFIVTSKNGKTVGGPIAHNCQDASPTAIGVALKTLTASKYGPAGKGVQVYFGTPKARGTYFETGLWDQSDKRYYFLGCTNKTCAHYFMLSSPGTDEWKSLWLYGQTIRCPKCGSEEDKRVLVENGKWMPTETHNIDGTEKKFVGYHISQLYVPTLDKNYILDQHPDNNKASSERIYYNEALGEFYSGNDMPISRDELELSCKDPERSFARIIQPNERKTWMGIDWGGKVDGENSSAGQSYSCVAVISADSTGTINLEFAYKIKSTDFQHKMEFVKTMFKNYNLRLAVADWGYGHDICNELQKIYGAKLISAETSGTMKKNVTYDTNQLRLHWNKDYYIEELFDLMRKGKVRFPWKSFEKMEWLIDHITSMEVAHTMVSGMPKKKYIKGAMPNDGFMAVIYAYLAYKYEISRGFSVNLNNASQNNIAMPKLIYMPKLR